MPPPPAPAKFAVIAHLAIVRVVFEELQYMPPPYCRASPFTENCA
jgi:hypothetical protein